MKGGILIRELEQWYLRRRQASLAPRANLALVSEDPGNLRRFGVKITEYLNQVDDPENGGWFLFDDELMSLLSGNRVYEPVADEGIDGCSGLEDPFKDLFSKGGAVIVTSGVWKRLPMERWDVQVLLTGSVAGGGDPLAGDEPRVIRDIDRYHASVNAGRLPGRMVVCLVGDAVLEWSYQHSECGLQ